MSYQHLQTHLGPRRGSELYEMPDPPRPQPDRVSPPKSGADKLEVFWHTSGFEEKFGPDPKAGYARAIIRTRTFDTRPYLGTAGYETNDGALHIDTGLFGGVFEMLGVMQLAPLDGSSLRTLTQALNIEVRAFEFGHPRDPNRATLFKYPADVTAQFASEVNESWAYEWQVPAQRFWGFGLVIEATSSFALRADFSTH